MKIIALCVCAFTLAGCSSAENLGDVKHDAAALSAGGGQLNSERFVVERPDGQLWNRTYSGTGDPMTVETTQDGLFSITGEGTVGGANIVFPSENPAQPPTILQMVGQNDLEGTGLEITLNNGSTAKAETFKISASETRRARAEALDRWTTIYATLTDAQKQAILADRDRFIAAVENLSPVAADALRALLPAP